MEGVDAVSLGRLDDAVVEIPPGLVISLESKWK
jgi:hypothetical protein